MFDSHRYAYVLAISETTRADSWEVQQIVRLPWAMVLTSIQRPPSMGF